MQNIAFRIIATVQFFIFSYIVVTNYLDLTPGNIPLGCICFVGILLLFLELRRTAIEFNCSMCILFNTYDYDLFDDYYYFNYTLPAVESTIISIAKLLCIMVFNFVILLL